MRPKHTILLVGDSEERISVLKFMLVTNQYAVIAVSSASKALLALLPGYYGRPFELLLCELPLAGVEDLLLQGHILNSSMRSLVMGEVPAESYASLCADVIYSNRPYREEPCMTDLLDRIKVLVARKRGPKPSRIPPAAAELLAEAQIARMA